jgi:hypothetical protein
MSYGKVCICGAYVEGHPGDGYDRYQQAKKNKATIEALREELTTLNDIIRAMA